MSTERPRRAVVTGIGVIAPNGLRADAYWKSVREGLGVLDRITREGCAELPLKVAGEVRGFDASDLIEDRFLVQTDRFSHYAMAAAQLALDDAGLARENPEEPFEIGVVTAAGSGGGEFGQRELQKLWGQGSRFVGPYQSIAWFYAASTGQISIRSGLKGPCGVVASDEAGGLDAIAHAARGVRRGTGAVLVGAAEAPLAPYSMVCQLGYPELSTVEDPDRAYRPFTAGACGFVPAEGGAMLVVEDESRARDRGAAVRAVVAGHGATFTGASRWEESREGLAHAIRVALDEAGCAPRRSTSSSPTPWAYRRRTVPRRWRSPTPSGRTRPGSPSRRRRRASAAPTAERPSWTPPPRCSRWSTAWCRPLPTCSTSATTSIW